MTHHFTRVLPAMFILAACSSEETTPLPTDADPAADACEHLEGGPFNDVTAASDDASAPDVSATHTSHDITLLDDGAGNFVGRVALAADEAAEILLFLDAPVPLEIFDATGASQPLEQPAECPGDACEPGCAAVKHHVAVDISSVGTYYVAFGPTTETEVALVHFEAEGHAH